MIRIKQKFLLFAAGVALTAGGSWADNQPSASASPTMMPATAPVAAKPGKKDGPTVAAMKAAIALADAGKTDEAIAAYEKMGVLKSKKMEAWRLNNEALVYLQLNKLDQAVPLLEKSTNTDPDNYVAWNNLGTAYEGTDKLEQAKDAYQKSIDAAKAANASSAKAEGNLQNLQPRLDKMAAVKGKSGENAADADDSKPDASPKTRSEKVK